MVSNKCSGLLPIQMTNACPRLVVEGETKVDLLRSWNIPATCCAGGAKKWREEHAAFLRGANMVILADNDDVGRAHMSIVAASLQGVAASIRVLEAASINCSDFCSIITQSNRVSSNQSLCCRETEFCRQRQRRRNGSGKPRRPLQRRDPRQQSRQFGVTCPELGNLRLRESAWWG
jgi:hypothetical protein